MTRSPLLRTVSRFLTALPAFLVVACDQGESAHPQDRAASSDSASARVVAASDAPAATGATRDSATATPASAVSDSARAAALAKAATFPEVHYSRLALTDRATLDSVRTKYGRKESHAAWRALTTLNRKEMGYIRVGDTIVVPDTVVDDLRAYSVFPQQYPGAASLPKLIMVTNALQAYACYEYGVLVRFAAANTGTESKATFPGRYALNWKERLRISSLNENWKLPFTWNFHKYAGNAFHQFDMPGRPVSHSCIRQFMEDAEWLFNWGEGGKPDGNGDLIPYSGTPVIIVDMFDFNRRKGGPWLELASNRDGILQLPADPMAVEEALIPISQVPANVRGGLPNRDRYQYAEDTLRARGVIRAEAHLSPSIDYNKRRAAKQARAQKAARRQSQPAPAPAPAEASAPAGAVTSPE
jgi:lipoprotein-anchoring transpeptidase ErfK/SrfK